MKIKLCLVVLVVLIAFFVILNVFLLSGNTNRVRLLNDGAGYCYSIENVQIDQNEVSLEGFFFEMKKIQNVEQLLNESKGIGVILLDTEVKEKTDIEYEKSMDFSQEAEVIPPKYDGVAMNMEYTKRDDVNRYFSCEYDYSSSGFRAVISADNLDLQQKTYRICIKLDKRYENAVATNYYLDKGKFVCVSPDQIPSLDVVGTDLQDIVEKGECLAVSSQYGIYVYQYGNDLYWISDNSPLLKPDNKTFIELHVETTQFDKIPEIRKDGGYFYDNIGANFENYEITNEINCGEYRVSRRPVPQNYSVTLLTTGYYENGGWLWSSVFRPRYDFS